MDNKTIKILAIDDNADNIISLNALVREAFPKSIFLSANDGKSGIKIAEAEDPDVILLDILMPDMDGFEVCKKLKSHKNCQDIPVVFLTALKADKQNRVSALECGAEGFLAKPVDESELKAQIRAMVKIKEATVAKHIEKEGLKSIIEKKTHDLEFELRERKKSEHAFKEEKELFDLFLKYSPVHAYIKEITPGCSRILRASDNFRELAGVSAEQMIGKTMEEIFPAEFAAKATLDDMEVVQEKKVIKIDESFGGRTFTTIKFPFLQKNRYLLAGYSIDITDRKLAEDKVRESEEKYKTLFEISQDAIFVNVNYSISFLNPSALRLFGAEKPEQIIGKSPMEIFHPDYHNIIEKRIDLMIRTGDPVGLLEEKIVTLEGKVVDVEVSAAPFSFQGEKAILVVLRDITEKKKQQALLQESEERFRLLYEHSIDGVLLTEPGGAILKANPAACKMFGRPEEEITDFGRYSIVDKTDPRLQKALEERAKTGKFLGELTGIRKDGTKFPIELSSNLFTDSTGKVRSSMLVRDISERKKAEEEINLKTRELERFNSLMVGRELKMIELKKEINGLLKKLGEGEKYVVVE